MKLKNRFRRRLIEGGIGLAIATWGGFSPSAQAIQLADGTVYFAQVPRLIKATTTFNDVRFWGATYYFTLSIPEDAGEPLQQVTFVQKEGLDKIDFNLKQTRAYENGKRDHPIALGKVSATQGRVISVTFEPPVPPGKTVTIALRPFYNPDFSGVYLFGVTAFPQGEKAHGQFLGYGRLQFYDKFNHGFFPFHPWWR
jgi:hypothetical protein